MHVCHRRRQHEQLPEFKKEIIVGMRETAWLARKVTRHVDYFGFTVLEPDDRFVTYGVYLGSFNKARLAAYESKGIIRE
ncbi:hypothetical protein TNCV_3885351 [Trichonephila clavipes]|nr:hypothetical protein TNCV_3885351 [Trichonephila clavipes]